MGICFTVIVHDKPSVQKKKRRRRKLLNTTTEGESSKHM